MAEDIRILIRAATEGLAQVTDAAKRIADLGGDASETEAKARKLKDELDQLATQQRLITQFQQLKTETGSTREALEQAQQRAQQLGREFSQTEQPTAKLKREFAAARGEVTQLRERLIAQNAALNETRGALTATGVNTKELAGAQVDIRARTAEAQQGLKGYATELDRTEQELRETKGQLAETEQQVDKTSGGFGRFKTALLGLGAALGVGGLGAILKNSSVAAADFGLKVAEVSTLLEDTSGIERITDASRELAKEFGNSPTEQAQAFYNIISAGTTDAAAATELLTQANKLAVGGVTDVATAADGITSVLNAYGLSADNAAKVSDQLFTTVRLGKTTVDEYSRAIGQLAPIAAQVGVGFDEVSAAVASLTANGVATSQAITQVRAAIANVLKPTSEARDLADELGINFSATGLKAKGLGEFLREVTTATGGNVESLTRLFGSTEAVQAVLGLTGDELARFDGNLQQVRESTGATDTAFEKVAGSDRSTAARMRAQFADIALTTGELTNRALIPLGTELAKIAGEFAATGESGRKMGEEVESASSRIAPVLSAIAGAVQIFSGGVQAFFNLVQIAARSVLASITDMAAGISLALAKVTFGDVSARLQADGENLRTTAREIRDGISTDLEDINRAGDKVRAGFDRATEALATLGSGAEAVTPVLDATADAADGLGETVGLTAAELDALGEGAEVAGGLVVQAGRAVAGAGNAAASAAPQVDALATSQRNLAASALAVSEEVSEAFKALNIQSSEQLRQQAVAAQAAFKTIRDSGVASAGDIERAQVAAKAAEDRYQGSLKTRAQLEKEAAKATAGTAAADRASTVETVNRTRATNTLIEALVAKKQAEEDAAEATRNAAAQRKREIDEAFSRRSVEVGFAADRLPGFNRLSAENQETVLRVEREEIQRAIRRAQGPAGIAGGAVDSPLSSQIANDRSRDLIQATIRAALASQERQNPGEQPIRTIRIELPRVGNFAGGAITTTDPNAAGTLEALLRELARAQSLSGAGA